MLVMFLSLAPPRDAKGRRAGEAMVVTVVMLSRCLEERISASGLYVRLAELTVAVQYYLDVGQGAEIWSVEVGEEGVEKC